MDIKWFGNELDDTTPIWRYIDIFKLWDILNNNRLYFSRVEEFEDPSEITHFPVHLLQTEIGLSNAEGFLKELKKRLCINCWHINNSESMGMWKSYNSNSGVAIVSNIKSLCGILQNALKKNACIGKVKYIDSTGEILTEDGKIPHLHFPFYKNKPWEYEQEFRVAYFLYCKEDPSYGLFEKASQSDIMINGTKMKIEKDGIF
ncbi:MAG: DUF2971 domain-containing protein [Phycisphaerae bacterium]|nr:DUF2971 domain-containing protein [Phycisphaerae bacterium]